MNEFWNLLALVVKGIPWAAIISSLSALAGIVVATRLSERKNVRERLWDVQREAYSQIFGSMDAVKEAIEDILHIVADVDPRHWPMEAVGEAMDRWGDSASEARRRFAKDRVVLPAAFAQIYLAFAQEMRSFEDPQVPTPQKLAEALNVIDSYRERMEQAARSALSGQRISRPSEF